MTLIGEFAAYRELASGELTTIPIAHPLFEGAQARVLVKTDRPLAAGPLELLKWILGAHADVRSSAHGGRQTSAPSGTSERRAAGETAMIHACTTKPAAAATRHGPMPKRALIAAPSSAPSGRAP